MISEPRALHQICQSLLPKGVMYSISPTKSVNKVNLVLTRIGTSKNVMCGLVETRLQFEAEVVSSLQFHQSSKVCLPNGPYTKEQFIGMVIKFALHLLTGEYV